MHLLVDRRHRSNLGTAFALGMAGIATPIIPVLAQVNASSSAIAPVNMGLSYADLADLALTAPIVAGVSVIKSERLKGVLAPGLEAGRARFLIQATTMILLRGTDGVPGTVSYIVDVPLDASGKAPKLKKGRFILFADRVPGRPQEVRLTSPYSQLDWTQSNESQLRKILTEAISPAAPPIVTGIGSAFHVPGAIPGESESQIFLTTRDNRPISLSILRRPAEQPQWAVALGEMVDDSARAPARDSLLWYRLACFLPSRLPDTSVAALSEGDAAAVREDYRFVRDQLGACGRTMRQR